MSRLCNDEFILVAGGFKVIGEGGDKTAKGTVYTLGIPFIQHFTLYRFVDHRCHLKPLIPVIPLSRARVNKTGKKDKH
jgi:hypothetical protein